MIYKAQYRRYKQPEIEIPLARAVKVSGKAKWIKLVTSISIVPARVFQYVVYDSLVGINVSLRELSALFEAEEGLEYVIKLIIALIRKEENEREKVDL